MNSGENASNAVAALEDAAERIRRIEAEAREALYVQDNTEAHRRKLQEKTMLLMELSDLVDPFLEGMAKDIRAEIETGLQSFARRASQALELSSIFYMSALLYPDDYREGSPNDLEVFVDRLRSRYLS
jgi:hypothetical protein